MLRIFIIFFYVVASLLFDSFNSERVAVKINVPTEVDAGTTFRVQVVLTKNQLESFSRFMQELPEGLTATSVNSSYADFTFEDNKVRFIWLKLPPDPRVTITYEVKVDERLKGDFSLNGKFSYIEDNERKSVEANTVNIEIIPSPDIDPSLIVDIDDFGDEVIPDLSVGKFEKIACVRQKPVYDELNNEFVVNILVYKNEQEKFAKIEDLVPHGYTAVNIESRNAIFTFNENVVKFLWMNLPGEPWFIVSYKLIPDPGTNVDKLEIEGSFSYIEDDKTIVEGIKEKNIRVKELNNQEVEKIIKNLPATGEEEDEYIAEPEPLTMRDEEVPTRKKTKTRQTTTNTGTVRANKNVSSISRRFLLQPEEGIYYRVQLAAGHKPVNIKKYFRKYTFTEEVRAEQHEGWHKYSVGSFKEYREARDYRVHVWNTTNINDAFVSAYNDGKRITVQEALMVSNQKWYK